MNLNLILEEKFQFCPRVIKYFFGHRGITHQFIFFLIPFFALFAFQTSVKEIDIGLFVSLVGFCLGVLFHQLGDMLSGSKKFKGGIKDYLPYYKFRKIFYSFQKYLDVQLVIEKSRYITFYSL